ncbi:FkbM family methyltransferase [Candidatus Micrarchaeota archaeon]|nr:FkbM family methyltransferase [Candidatus Micrarchaeota archaeon]
MGLAQSAVNGFLGIRNNVIKIGFEAEGKKMHARVPDEELFIAIKDVLLNREYEYKSEFELVNFRGKLVVDAGAHVGLFSMLASVFARKVVSVEPSAGNYDLLRENISQNSIGNVTAINKALWADENGIDFYEAATSSGHSAIACESHVKKTHVETTTIESIVKEHGDIDLLKMDIEGSEFGVFRAIDSAVLKRIKKIVAEIHAAKGEPGLIAQRLEAEGFKVEMHPSPLCAAHPSYAIKTSGLLKVKLLRGAVYPFAPLFRNRQLLVLFAQRE